MKIYIYIYIHLPIGETVRGTLDLCLVHVIFIYLMIVE